LEWIWEWATAERIGLLSAGAVLFAMARWFYFEFHGNAAPKEGEPNIYVEHLTDRLPNGRIYRISIRNLNKAPIWLEELVPRSRAFGRILYIPTDAFTDETRFELDLDRTHEAAPLRTRLDADGGLAYHFWIAGQDWPIWRFALILKWSPYGPAARTISTKVHCST
jgi:hypothetical protein